MVTALTPAMSRHPQTHICHVLACAGHPLRVGQQGLPASYTSRHLHPSQSMRGTAHTTVVIPVAAGEAASNLARRASQGHAVWPARSSAAWRCMQARAYPRARPQLVCVRWPSLTAPVYPILCEIPFFGRAYFFGGVCGKAARSWLSDHQRTAPSYPPNVVGFPEDSISSFSTGSARHQRTHAQGRHATTVRML